MNIVGIILWVLIVGAFLAVVIGQKMRKKQYEGQNMDITTDWYEQSQNMYANNDEKQAYYLHFDKDFLNCGHILEDRNHNVIYEADVLYGSLKDGYEVDFKNHAIDYNSHHNISAVATTYIGDGTTDIALASSFTFDGVNIWEYLESLGYYHHFIFNGLTKGYQIDIERNGAYVGTIYSSNMGKNLYDNDGPIESQLGPAGYFVLECACHDLDAMFLWGIAYARTELSSHDTHETDHI